MTFALLGESASAAVNFIKPSLCEFFIFCIPIWRVVQVLQVARFILADAFDFFFDIKLGLTRKLLVCGFQGGRNINAR